MKRNFSELVEVEISLTIDEICRLTHLNKSFVIELIEHELIEPEGDSLKAWRFDSTCLRRLKLASSFHRDLEINLPGTALALQLLDQIEQMENRLRILEKMFENRTC